MKNIIGITILSLSLLTGCQSTQEKYAGFVEGGVAVSEQNEKDEAPSVAIGGMASLGNNFWIENRVGFQRGDDKIEDIALHTNLFFADFGVRQYAPIGKFEPYLGAGVTGQILHATTSEDESESDMAIGLYGVAGIDYRLSKDYTLGLQYRHTAGGDFKLGEERENFDAGTVALVFGWSF